MISHVSIGVRDLGKAGRFYDAALAPLGYKRLYDSAEALGYGADSPKLWVMRVERPVAPDEASGLHAKDCQPGSSPRVRGTLAASPVVGAGPRFIPARAGNS